MRNVGLLVVLLGLILLLPGCSDQSAPPPSSSHTPADPGIDVPDGPSDYLALGDSYTVGQSIASEDQFPRQLARRLRDRGSDPGTPTVIARTGWTCADLQNALDRHPLDAVPYRLVTLLIGVNDQFQGVPIERYPQAFTDLLNRAIRYAGGEPQHVIVVSIPDYGVTPFGQRSGNSDRIGRQLDRYNTINQRITREAGARYVNITDISRQGADDPSLQAPDGLHPSAAQYGRWVDRLLPIARQVVKDSQAASSAPAGD